MDDVLVAAEWQGKTALATAAAPELEEPSAPGLSSSPAHSTETPPVIPLFPDLPFEGTLSVGTHSLSPLLALYRKSKTALLAAH